MDTEQAILEWFFQNPSRDGYKSENVQVQVSWDVAPCRLVISDVSENRNSLIFRVKQSKKVESDPEDKGGTRLQRPSNYLPVDTA
jgi:hypothetical protein